MPRHFTHLLTLFLMATLGGLAQPSGKLARGTSAVWGTNVFIEAESALWGTSALWRTSALWGSSALWGTSTPEGESTPEPTTSGGKKPTRNNRTSSDTSAPVYSAGADAISGDLNVMINGEN